MAFLREKEKDRLALLAGDERHGTAGAHLVLSVCFFPTCRESALQSLFFGKFSLF